MGIAHSTDLLVQLTSRWRSAGYKIGFTCGAFDLLHAGHVSYLAEARKVCDRLIVAVNSDESVRQYKNHFRPIQSEDHRLMIVSALSSVDVAILMRELQPTEMIKLLQPDLYIKGGDYSVDQLRSKPSVEAYGGRCVVIPVSEEVSTTKIIRRVQELSVYAQPDERSARGRQRVAFLDRDGTLIQNVPYLNSAARVQLLPGVGEGLKALQEQGFILAVITNQQGLGLGYFDYDAFLKVNSRMFELLASYGVKLTRFYFCPHSIAEDCDCRKPRTGLVDRALLEFRVRASDCIFIGDSEADMACAAKVGCQAILVGHPAIQPLCLSAKSFTEAVEIVLASRPTEVLST
jgi:D-glycero-D-manno-heptose 1,7-bisphosphate phosphatase